MSHETIGVVRGRVLRVDVAAPTLVSVPRRGAHTADTERVRTKYRIFWPDNWGQLPPKWKAALIRELLEKVIQGALAAERGEPAKQAVLRELYVMLGWKRRGGGR